MRLSRASCALLCCWLVSCWGGDAIPKDAPNGTSDVEEAGGIDTSLVGGAKLQENHQGEVEENHGNLPEEIIGEGDTQAAQGIVVYIEQSAFAVSAAELATSQGELAGS